MKLAEYNLETGKFEKFLELGHDFFYGGNFIITSSIDNKWFFGEGWYHIKDEKDPLNRFDGLFNGRTYGIGRFVLVKSFECVNNKIIYDHDVFPDLLETKTIIFKSGKFEFNCGCCYAVFGTEVSEKFDINKKIGNLHENPELWEETK